MAAQWGRWHWRRAVSQENPASWLCGMLANLGSWFPAMVVSHCFLLALTMPRPGLPKEARQQLACDIDEAGGIEKFDKGDPAALDKIPNPERWTKPDPRKEKLHKPHRESQNNRRQITNQVQKWKSFTKKSAA